MLLGLPKSGLKNYFFDSAKTCGKWKKKKNTHTFTLTHLYNNAIFHGPLKRISLMIIQDIFLSFAPNIDCECSLEVLTSTPNIFFFSQKSENNHHPCKSHYYLYQVKFSLEFVTRTCLRDNIFRKEMKLMTLWAEKIQVIFLSDWYNSSFIALIRLRECACLLEPSMGAFVILLVLTCVAARCKSIELLRPGK